MQASRNFRVGIGRFCPEQDEHQTSGGPVGKRGYILTSFYAWDASNRSEDVLTYGPEILDLRARDLTSQEVNDLFLQAQSGDSAGLESEQDDDSHLDEANPAIVRFLARSERVD